MATCYLVCAACFGCGARLLSISADARRSRPAAVAGALAVITASVLVGLLGGPAGLLGWTTMVVGLSGCRWSRRPAARADRTERDPLAVPGRVPRPAGEPSPVGQ